LSKAEIDRYQKGLIITDDVSVAPILDFKYYKQVIIDIIKKSYPKFSIGVFVEWGTGKTTLMNNRSIA
jgi:predicted KAP-like P-loop ATPase